MGGIDPNFIQQSPKAKPAPLARYRSTATLVSLILQGGHQSPHRTLDYYVKGFTGSTPTDGERWTTCEPPLPSMFEIAKLSFERLSESSCFK